MDNQICLRCNQLKSQSLVCFANGKGYQEHLYEKEFPQEKENYCPQCYFELERVILRSDCLGHGEWKECFDRERNLICGCGCHQSQSDYRAKSCICQKPSNKSKSKDMNPLNDETTKGIMKGLRDSSWKSESQPSSEGREKEFSDFFDMVRHFIPRYKKNIGKWKEKWVKEERERIFKLLPRKKTETLERDPDYFSGYNDCLEKVKELINKL